VNGWDTGACVSVRASHNGSVAQDRLWQHTIDGSGLDKETGTWHDATTTGHMGCSGDASAANPRGGTINDGVYGNRWIEYRFIKSIPWNR